MYVCNILHRYTHDYIQILVAWMLGLSVPKESQYQSDFTPYFIHLYLT